MPNRIIKESICTSESIDQLSTFQENLFYRLMVKCDDYGRFDGRPKVIASLCYPLKDIRVQQIEDALRALTSAELVTLYNVNGKPFLQMKTWDKHQQIRAKRSKFPAPDGERNTSDSICNQMISDDNKCPRNPNPNPNPNPNTNASAGARAREAKAPSLTVTHGEPPESSEPETRRGLERAFDAFWAAYPLHKSKVKAYEAFQALNPDEKLLEAMILAIRKQVTWRRMREGYIPMPAKWIQERRWEDDEEPELRETKPRRVLAGQDYEQREYNEEEMKKILNVDGIFRADDPDSMFYEG